MAHPRRTLSRPNSAIAAAAIASSLLAHGCGRRASEADCEQIVARITELELRRGGVTDPTEIRDEVQASQSQFKDQATTECVGRRISERAMECVRNATSAEQIVEGCFD